MGSCVSMHKLSIEQEPKSEKLLIPSPVKPKTETVNARDLTVADVALKSNNKLSPARFLGPGSKDESFFDSQPWLDSDCEDDYYSVNGDFTPSRGNTPVHHNFALGKLQVNKSPIAEQTNGFSPEPSPPEKKKRLSELFMEGVSADQTVDHEENRTSTIQQPKSTSGTPYLPGANSAISSETTPGGLLADEEKTAKYSQCCIPRLLGERRKRTSPTNSVG